MRRTGTWSWRRHAPAIAVLVAIVLATFVAFASFAAVQPNDVVVTVKTPLTGLVDGSKVTFNIQAGTAALANQVEIRQCRLGPTYGPAQGTGLESVNPDAGNCPVNGVSSFADSVVRRFALANVAALPDEGADISYVVGTGTAEWGNPKNSLTCGVGDDCALVMKLNSSSKGTEYKVFPISFADDDPISSCGSLAPGILQSASSDEMKDAWAAWTRGYCAAGTTGAPSRAAFTGEGDAMKSFASPTEGTSPPDIVYTAAGYNPSIKLVAADAAQRASVAVPIAVNAAVFSAGGGYDRLATAPDGTVFSKGKAPYPEAEVDLTAGEIGAFFSGGISYISNQALPYQAAISARNPILQHVVVSTNQVLASSKASASIYYLTDVAHDLAPDEYIVAGTTERREPTANPALAKPDFSNSIQTFTGRPTLARKVYDASQSGDQGPLWVATDLATARAAGLTPVDVVLPGGSSVGPTTGSMLAAVAAMQPDDRGMRIPDPAALAGVSGAYPATYVLYALVPAEPLVDQKTCVARADSQTLLHDWLEYVTGPGQDLLPAGMVPLPDVVQTEATEAIAKVGTATVTGTCAGRVTTPGGGAFPGPSGGGSGATAPPFAATRPAAVPGAVTPVASASASGTPTREDDVKVIVPAFAGSSAPEPFDGAFALAAIVLVTSLAVFITARTLARSPGGGRRTVGLVVLWGAVAAAGISLVIYEVGPLMQQRDQEQLLAEYKQEVKNAAGAENSLGGAASAEDARAPEPGAPIGILEIGRLKVQAVAVQGMSPSQTRMGPGHVPGTAGLGQPSNSVLVARRNSYGASFQGLDDLHTGDKIVAVTTQGQSVYKVRSITQREISDKLYAPSDDDRLTLITSGSRAPWNDSTATVVVAKMQGLPFEPTPQGSLTQSDSSLREGGDAWTVILLTVMGYALVLGLSVLLYRKLTFRVAYLLSIAPIVALTVVTGEVVTRVLPAWT